MPVPFIFDGLPFGVMNKDVRAGFVRAAEMAGTMVVIPEAEIDWRFMAHIDSIIPLVCTVDLKEERLREIVGRARIVELKDGPDILEQIETVKEFHPSTVTSVRMPMKGKVAARVEELTRAGAEVIHLAADWQGNEPDESDPKFMKDVLREVHLNLTDKALRDEVTLIASGGIAMAEHVAKAIICGADMVGIDLVLEIALECRVCKRCRQGLSCPAAIETVDPEWAALRIRNLVCSWHSQLIEVLGAMGLREVRRLRGEVGRAMFYENLETEAFGDIRVAPDNYCSE